MDLEPVASVQGPKTEQVELKDSSPESGVIISHFVE